MGIYARDGSLNVTLVDDGQPITTSDDMDGVYARDGSLRVTIVSGGLPADGAVVQDTDVLQIPVTGNYVDTVTFTVENNEITAITLS
jgi:hypothetical protein